MKDFVLIILLTFLVSCEITETYPFLQVGLENQNDHEGIFVKLYQDFGNQSTFKNSMGEFSFDSLYEGEAVIVCGFPFFEPDTQTITVINGKVVDWNPVILKQILFIELMPDEIVFDYADFFTSGNDLFAQIQVKIINYNHTDFYYSSVNQPGYCEVIKCMLNKDEANNLFTIGYFGDNDFPTGVSGIIKSGETIFDYSFYIDYDQIVRGEYELYLAPNNSENDPNYFLLNEYVYKKRNIIKPVRMIVE